MTLIVLTVNSSLLRALSGKRKKSYLLGDSLGGRVSHLWKIVGLGYFFLKHCDLNPLKGLWLPDPPIKCLNT